MYHELLRDASFWTFLFRIDQDLAETCRREACGCGGRLHVADYPRKPRGAAGLPDDYRRRLSFCCDRDGCRKRTTPPSVRFLGRKVYLGVVVILVSAMRQGATRRRVRELSQVFGSDRRTIARWRTFWSELFPMTKFWHTARARLALVIEIVALPRSLVEAFVHTEHNPDEWRKLLMFLAPITTRMGLELKVSAEPSKPAEDAVRQF